MQGVSASSRAALPTGKTTESFRLERRCESMQAFLNPLTCEPVRSPTGNETGLVLTSCSFKLFMSNIAILSNWWPLNSLRLTVNLYIFNLKLLNTSFYSLSEENIDPADIIHSCCINPEGKIHNPDISDCEEHV